MAELNHFRKYAIAQSEEGDPLEIVRDEVRVVCLGFDTSRHRFVEIGALIQGDREVFVSRARKASSVRHPAVAAVFDYGKEDDSCFYVADFVDGEMISDYAARVKAVAPGTVVTWLLQLAEGYALLEAEGLEPDVSSARLMMTDESNSSLIIVDHGISKPGKQCRLGDELADQLEALTNYQDAEESPVYPPEVESLSTALRGMSDTREVVEALEEAVLEFDPMGLSSGQHPRLILEKQLFRRMRPEHVLPDRYSVIQRAGELSPYESIVEDAANGEMFRVLILPPERIIPERVLDIYEEPECPSLIAISAFWKHQEFRLIAELMEPGFSLSEWLDAVPRCEAGEMSSILLSLEEVIREISAGALNPRLHPADIFFVFPEAEDDLDCLLSEGIPVSQWPEYELIVRPHRTIRALTDITFGDVPGGADEVFESVKRGDWVPSELIVSWYLSLWRRGLVHQAEELVGTLQETRSTEEAGNDDGAAGSERPDREKKLVLSPIAEAMGIIGDDPLSDDEINSNPIARQIWLGDDADDSPLEEGYPDELQEEEFNPGEKAVKMLFVLLAAIAVAVAIAHCSGKAFWL
ncbi:MAG: hypothetical protein MK183_07165 [Verrucomicrobiales bacterium]|nr:hypothetical protein [Verrucomicrobiales bacterium]